MKKLEVIDLVKNSLKRIVEHIKNHQDLDSEELADIALSLFVEDVGGITMYIRRIDISEIRNKKIRAEFTGNNHLELARKYQLTPQWIYKILKGDA